MTNLITTAQAIGTAATRWHRNLFLFLMVVFSIFINAHAFTLSGTVKGGSTGLADVTVELTNADTTANFAKLTANTDSNGSYRFSINSAGTYNMLVTPTDLKKYAVSRVSSQISTQDVVQDILLLPVVGQLSGKVSFPDGTAAAGVVLTVKTNVKDVGVNVTTNSVGNYTVGMSAGTYLIGVSDSTSGYLSGGSWFDTAFVAPFAFSADAVKNITLPYVKLTGKTVDANNAPTGGVDVSVAYKSLPSTTNGGSAALQGGTTTKSDASGNYTLGLPASAGYQVVMTKNAQTYLLSDLDAQITKTMNLALKAGRILSGIITFPNGSPAEGVQVSIKPTGGGSESSTLTDATGKYMFGLTGGNYVMGLNDCSFKYLGSACWWDDAYIQNIDMSVNVTKDIQLPYVISIGQTKIKDGTPTANMEVVTGARTLVSVGGGTSGLTDGTKAKSDSSGNYVLTLPAATNYTLGLFAPNGASAVMLTNQNYSASSYTANLTLTAAASLSGKITFPDNTGAPGVNVTVAIQGSSSNLTIATDSAGNYSLGLPNGSYDLGLSDCSQKFLNGGCWFDTKYLAGVPVNGTSTKNIALPYARLTGKTTDRNGVYVPGVVIDVSFEALKSANSGGIALMTAGTKTVSDESGDYSLSLPIANNYQLLISPTQGSNFKNQTLSNFAMTQSKQQTIVLPYTDTTPPIIVSGPIFRAVNSKDAVVEWQTDKPTTGSVTTGTITNVSANLATIHSVHLTGLTGSTEYTVTVSATDEFLNGPTTKVGKFKTATAADTSPPVILMGPTVVSKTETKMVVEWVTNKPSKGQVQYGVNNFSSSATESALSILHKVELSGLTGSTTYQLRVTATDAANNGPTTSRTVSATTLPAADTSPPVITNGPLISNIRENSVSVTWVTDEPSVSGVSWNDGTVHGLITDTKLSTVHMQQVTGLKPGTNYKLTVSSTDGLGNGPSLSKTVQFKTLPSPVVDVPQILSPQEVTSVTNTTAMVMWGTDQPSSSEISYGTDKNNLSLTEVRAPLVTRHNVPLVGLLPDTTYYVQVKSINASGAASVNSYVNSFTGNTSVSFVTLKVPVTSLPIFQTPPAVGYATSNAAVIDVVTDKAADTVVSVKNKTFSEPPKVGVDGDLNLSHQVSLTNLTPSSKYDVTVTSTDISGNTVTSVIGSFDTPPMPDSTVPKFTVAPSVQAMSTMATVTWATDKMGDSRVTYGATNSAIEQSTGDLSFTKNHKVILASLKPSTAYQVKVTSTDPSGNVTASNTANFTTLAAGNDTTGASTSTTNGNTTTTVGNVTTTTFGSATASMSSVSMIAGWNLIGNGLDQTVNVSNVFGDKNTFTTVWKWVASKSAWAFYAPSFNSSTELASYASSKGYEVLTTINAGEGFWVNSQKATTVNLVNSSSATALASSSFATTGSKALPAGWSLISVGDNKKPSEFNLAQSGASSTGVTGTSKDLTTLWAWDAQATNWMFFAPSLATAGTLDTYVTGKGYQSFGTKTLTPSTGFWVNK